MAMQLSFLLALIPLLVMLSYGTADDTKLADCPPCNLTCPVDQECRQVDGVDGCHCKSKTFSCNSHNMIASISSCELDGSKFNINALNVTNKDCILITKNATTNMISFIYNLKPAACNIDFSRNATHAIYRSRNIIIPLVDNIVYREKYIVSVNCTYPLSIKLGVDTALIPIVNEIPINLSGTGDFAIKMTVCSDINYQLPYQGISVELSTTTMLYVGVFLDGPDPSSFAVVMQNCYATPSSSADDPTKFYMITNSCPNRQDTTISVIQNGVSEEAKYSVQMFKFISDDHNKVYLHCEVYLCDRTSSSSCQPSCSGSRSADAKADLNPVKLTLGPFQRSEPSSTAGTRASWAAIIPAFLIISKSLFSYKLF